MSKTVCASDYGGPGDPTTGYRGDNLNGKMAFAELMMGTALGNLPYRAKVQISYNGRSVMAEKLDIGLGGPGCGGHSRAIDLWYQTAQALGFNGLDVVTVTLPGEAAQGGTTRDVGFGIPGENIPEELLEGKIPNPLKPFEEGANTVKGAFGLLGKIPGDFDKIYLLLFTPAGWIRIGKVLLGVFLLLSGALGMANLSAPEVDTKTAYAVGVAGKAKDARGAAIAAGLI